MADVDDTKTLERRNLLLTLALELVVGKEKAAVKHYEDVVAELPQTADYEQQVVVMTFSPCKICC